MEEEFVLILLLPVVAWLVLYFVGQQRSRAAPPPRDDDLLEELCRLARRLDERMDTIERLIAAEHPEFHPETQRDRLRASAGERHPEDLDRLLARKEHRP